MGIESDNSTLKVFCFNLEFIKFVGVETIAFYFVTSRFDFLQDCYNFVLFLVLLYSLLIDETLQLRSIISNENNIFKYLIVCFWKQWYSFFTSKYSCFIRQSYNIYTCNLDGSKKKKKIQENVMVTRVSWKQSPLYGLLFQTGSVHDWSDNDSFIKSTSTFYPIVISYQTTKNKLFVFLEDNLIFKIFLNN